MPSPVVVRPALADDGRALARCHVACWREAYAPLLSARYLDGLDAAQFARRWRERLAEGPRSGVHVAVVGDEVVGFASGGPSRDEPAVRELELWALYVRADRYGSGLGQALLDTAVADAPCSLWVARDNPRARAFYARNRLLPDGAVTVDDELEGLVEVRLVR